MPASCCSRLLLFLFLLQLVAAEARNQQVAEAKGFTKMLGNLYLRATTNTIIAEWDPYAGADQYRISWDPADTNNTSEDTTNATVYTIEDLEACKHYNVTVQAMQSSDDMEGGVDRDETDTKPMTPSGVKNLEVTVDCQELVVTWDDTEAGNCIVSYLVTWEDVDGSQGSTSTNDTSFTITGLNPDTNYTVCVTPSAGGSLGSMSCRTDATEDDIPGVPEAVTVQEARPESLWVSWQEPVNHCTPITHYSLTWREASGDKPVNSVNATDNNYNITDLVPCTSYTVTVTAATVHEYGDPATITDDTDNVAPSDVEQLEVVTVECQDLKATWTPSEAGNCIVSYLVTWEDVDGSQGSTNTSDTSFTITGLNPDTNYTVCVTPSAGELSSSPTCGSSVTNNDTPGPTENLQVEEVFADAMSIAWEEPLEHCGPILHYVVSWSSGDDDQRTDTTKSTSYNMTDLAPCTTYTVNVAAVTQDQTGPDSSTSNTTDVVEPGEPRDLTTEASTTHITVTWLPPDEGATCVQYYQLSWQEESDTRSEAVHLPPAALVKALPGSPRESPHNATVPGNQTFYTINDLQPDTSYLVSVQAFNNETGFSDAATPETSIKTDSKTNVGAIVGGVVGGLLVVTVASVFAAQYYKKYRLKKEAEAFHSESEMSYRVEPTSSRDFPNTSENIYLARR